MSSGHGNVGASDVRIESTGDATTSTALPVPIEGLTLEELYAAEADLRAQVQSALRKAEKCEGFAQAARAEAERLTDAANVAELEIEHYEARMRALEDNA